MQRWLCPSLSSFFGLGPNYRPVLYDQIFDLLYFGKMGLTFTEVYALPVYLRRYYYTKLADYLKKESDAQKGTTSSNPVARPPKVK